MKKAVFLTVFFFAAPLSADVYKFRFNPHTNRMDWVNNMSSTSVGSLVDVSTASLDNGECLVWNSSTNQFESGSCGSGGAPWPIAVSTNGVIISSPTTNINFMPPFNGTLDGSSTAQITLNTSSVTLLGPTIEATEISNVNAGTDVTADLEEETHVSEHQNNGADELNVAGLSGLLADTQTIVVSTEGFVVNTSSGINFKAGSNISLSAVATSSNSVITISATAGGTGDITDVNAGYGIAVANPGGPAPTVNLVSDATAYAQNRDTLQAGASVYVDFLHAGTSATVNGLLAVDTDVIVAGQSVCLEDGTNCPPSSGGSDNLGSHVATKTITAGFGISATTGVFTTSIQLPNGTGPTVDAVGEMAVDTTENQLLWYDGVDPLVVPSTFSKTMVIINPSAGDSPFFWKPHKDITLLYAVCVSSSNDATVHLQECNADGASCSIITPNTSCATTETAISITDTAIVAGNRIRVKIVSHTSPQYVGIDVYYRETRK